MLQHFKFTAFPYTVVNIYVNQQLGEDYMFFNDYSVLSVDSEITGFTLFENWQPISSSHTMDSYNSIVDHHAVVHFTLVHKNFGRIISMPNHFRMTMNATDGSIISQSWIE